MSVGHYRVQLRRNNQVWAGEFGVPWGGVHVLRRDELALQPLHVALRKGNALNPQVWELSAGAVIGKMALSTHNALKGGTVALARHLGGPWLLRAHLEVATANGGNALWRYSNNQFGGGLSVGYAVDLYPLVFRTWLGVNYLVARQGVVRRVSSPDPSLSSANQSGSTDAFGPGVQLEFHLPIQGRWFLGLSPELRALVLHEDEARVLRGQYTLTIFGGYNL